MTLLAVKNLSIAFGDAEPVVKPLSFNIEPGETVALVGESGSGKSVTALSILSLLGDKTQINGEVLLEGEQILGQSKAILRALRGNQISMIFQEPLSSLNPLHTVAKQLSEVMIIHQGKTRTQVHQRCIELLDLVGIKEPELRLKSYPHELSGGQRQRVMIAMALANEPKLLIADEPTTALDVTIQKQILELLADIQKKMNMAILFISHDLNVVRHIADRVMVMRYGELLETNQTEELFSNPQHPYTQELIDAEPSPIKRGKIESEVLLQAKDLKVWFPLKKGILQKTYAHIKAVDGISFELRRGETLGVVGESGSGKSTLAQAMLRLIESRGGIFFNGQQLDRLNNQAMRRFRSSLQIVFQDPFSSLSPRMSVRQIVGEGLALHQPQLSETELHLQVIKVLEDVGLDESIVDRYPHEFSGGQRQRISIARALILRPQILVLDEPTSALDRSVQKQLLDLLQSLQQRYNLSYLFISHDLSVIRALSHRVMVMQQGIVVEQQETERLFTHPKQAYTRQLIEAALI